MSNKVDLSSLRSATAEVFQYLTHFSCCSVVNDIIACYPTLDDETQPHTVIVTAALRESLASVGLKQTYNALTDKSRHVLINMIDAHRLM